MSIDPADTSGEPDPCGAVPSATNHRRRSRRDRPQKTMAYRTGKQLVHQELVAETRQWD